MKHKVLIDGTSYKEISEGKVNVGGTEYKNIEKGKVRIDGAVYEVGFGKPFADSTWEEIIAACQNRTVPDNWVVGDQKVMTINGADYPIDIIGKNHDVYSDGSGVAPLTFQIHNIYNSKLMNLNNATDRKKGWQDSYMRTTHLPSIKALMPSEVQDAIRKVNKSTCSATGPDATDILTLEEELFLLSEIEIFGNWLLATYSKSGEGSQYPYYTEGANRKKTYVDQGDTTEWWTRSPSKNWWKFCVVAGSGPYEQYVEYSRGVAFAFCF